MGKAFSRQEKTKLQLQAYHRLRATTALRPPYMCPICGRLTVFIGMPKKGVDLPARVSCSKCDFSERVDLTIRQDYIDTYNIAVDQLADR